MNLLLKWSQDSLELQAYGLGERVALFMIAVVGIVALAWILTRSRRSPQDRRRKPVARAARLVHDKRSPPDSELGTVGDMKRNARP